ncbi:fluoride efflux transporter CrcB [Heyndrickxia camelliae]|uniref:Fluoride-specific ion channel FluC n=1 Tax=Heyndrickxia camelliae TaxID=1707093 RepID=A0A2N3LPT9_9BACI|nr:fluoride efflux transporter CrcB [Heyndrickxia camelliae]PKR86630.1 fluoride efflux transporter CrcB [Heyndrickxia camelliae]
MLNIALVAIGGFFGAISRFSLSNLIKSKAASSFPFATLIVNLLGSFLLGVIIGANLDRTWALLVGTGFMGAFTTFSTFKLENIILVSKKNWKMLILYLGVSYTFGILLAFLGIKIGQYLV